MQVGYCFFVCCSIFLTSFLYPYREYTQKTVSVQRPYLFGLPDLFYISTLLGKKKDRPYISFAGAYQTSFDGDKAASYFSLCSKGHHHQGIIVSAPQTKTAFLDNTYLLHNAPNSEEEPSEKTARLAHSTLAGSLNFKPSIRTYGVTFLYKQPLAFLCSGLYFLLKAPLVDVRTNLKLSYQGTSQKLRYPRDTNIENSYTGPTVTLLDFFAGRVENNQPSQLPNPNKQLALEKMKMLCGGRGCAGIADLFLTLGYEIIKNKEIAASIAFNTVVPCGKKAKGEYVFEPIYGNGGHWYVGPMAHVSWNTKKDECGMGVKMEASYFYGCRAEEIRCPLIKIDEENLDYAAHYKLAAVEGNQVLFPVANKITQSFHVTPRHTTFCSLGAYGSYKKFFSSLTYFFFYRSSERVSCADACSYDVFSIASPDYPTTRPFVINTDSANKKAVRPSHYDLSSITAPHAATHTLAIHLGYKPNHFSSPAAVECGAAWEIATNNSLFSQIAVWFSGTLAF